MPEIGCCEAGSWNEESMSGHMDQRRGMIPEDKRFVTNLYVVIPRWSEDNTHWRS